MKLTKSQRYYIYERDGKRCRYCGKPLALRQLTLDHYVPRGAGGPTEVFNLVASCRHCNKEKYDRIPQDAAAVQITLFRKAVIDGMIRPDKNKIKEWDPGVPSDIDTVYANAQGTLFEGGGYRCLVRRHRIVRTVRYHIHED